LIDIQESDLYALEQPGTDQTMGLRFDSATAYSLEAIADLFTQCFEGAVAPILMTADDLSRMIRSDSVDLSASRILTREGLPCGFILVGTRGWSRRVSAMGVVATERKRGLGRRLMEVVIEDARRRGFQRIFLEVIDRNTAALELYRHLGFTERRLLVGYEKPDSSPAPPDADLLKKMDPRKLAKVVEYEAPPDLPWQLASETIAASGPPAVALRLEDKAYALVTPEDPSLITISTVVVPHAIRRQGWGMRLMRALDARYPHRNWRLPVRFPENLAPGFFTCAGFRRTPLAQYEMVLDLEPHGESDNGFSPRIPNPE
jgi:ribosomal protein S18 acetylase RimI-like enzyme